MIKSQTRDVFNIFFPKIKTMAKRPSNQTSENPFQNILPFGQQYSVSLSSHPLFPYASANNKRSNQNLEIQLTPRLFVILVARKYRWWSIWKVVYIVRGMVSKNVIWKWGYVFRFRLRVSKVLLLFSWMIFFFFFFLSCKFGKWVSMNY